MLNTKLAAVHIGRRSVAIAIFAGTQLEYVQIRHLSSDQSAAEKTLVEFVRRMLAQFEIDRVALQHLLPDAPERAQALHSVLTSSLREAAVSIWNIPEPDIMNTFGVPPLTSRGQLHQTISQIWPWLKNLHNGQAALGATAIGLYFQTEHILSLATQPE
jgi:hypothetical protein